LESFASARTDASEELRTFWGVSTLLGILAGIDGNHASQLMHENEDVGQLVETIVERSFPVAVGKAREGKSKNPTGPS